MSTEDWKTLALKSSREEFVAAHPHPFLLALSGLDAPSVPQPTVRVQGGPALVAALKAERRRLAAGVQAPTVLPVRKVTESFPSMITVGRTRNNDIVVPDALVSKFHAFFRQVDDGEWTLADAGSSNGTSVGDRPVPPKGTPERVRPGERVTFGISAFRFVDAGRLWTALRDQAH